MSLKKGIKTQTIKDVFLYENRVKGEIAYLNFTLVGEAGKTYPSRIISLGNSEKCVLVILGLKSYDGAVKTFGQLGAYVYKNGGAFTTANAHPGLSKHLVEESVVSLKSSPKEKAIKEQVLKVLIASKTYKNSPIVQLEHAETSEGSKGTLCFKAHVQFYSSEQLEEQYPLQTILDRMSYDENQYKGFLKTINN